MISYHAKLGSFKSNCVSMHHDKHRKCPDFAPVLQINKSTLNIIPPLMGYQATFSSSANDASMQTKILLQIVNHTEIVSRCHLSIHKHFAKGKPSPILYVVIR